MSQADTSARATAAAAVGPPAPLGGCAATRHARIDALRGAAVLWMAAFHFCYDLNYFGFIETNFRVDPVWLIQRTCIVTIFLFCAGLSQAVVMHAIRRAGTLASLPFDARFWRRWGQIAGCALLVSAGSWWMFPNSYIFFGVLHGIAVMLLLLRLLAMARLPPAGWLAIGALALAAPWLWQSAWFDSRWLAGVGLGTRKPLTEDFVPVLPWFGAMLCGAGAGRWLLTHRPRWLTGAIAAPLRPLAALGRWSLTFYMLHQPVLIGLLAALLWLRR